MRFVGFPGPSQYRAFRLLDIGGLQEREGTRDMSEAAEEASKWLWIIHGVARQGMINPGWLVQARTSDDLRPETPRDPGSIANDVSKLHQSGVSYKKYKMIFFQKLSVLLVLYLHLHFLVQNHLLQVLCVEALILQRQGGHFLLVEERFKKTCCVFVSLPDEASIPKHISVCLSRSA